MIDYLSYSSVNMYLLCPASWKKRYIDKVSVPTSPNLVFGSAVHAAIEQYTIANRAGNVVQSAAEIFAEDWQTRIGIEKIAWGEEDAAGLEAAGKTLLDAPDVVATIDSLVPLLWHDRLAIEEKVTLHVPGLPIPVIGYIDLIAQDGVPCDFKTANRKWSADKAREETQPLFYLAALNQAGLPLDWRFRHYVFVKGAKPTVQVFETVRNPAELFQLFQQILDVYQAIKAQAFPCNTSTWKCSPKYCEYWLLCRGKS